MEESRLLEIKSDPHRPEGHSPADPPIVLISGRMRSPDHVGHHDYLAGCTLLRSLLARSSTDSVLVRDGWPSDEAQVAQAKALVFYTPAGDSKVLLDPQRRAWMQRLVDRGVGLVMIHQAVRFTDELAELAMSWLGGAYVRGVSGRGHWGSSHRLFPDHPVMRGVQPWSIVDGWHNRIRFQPEMRGVTPLLWSGPRHAGGPDGGVEDIVSWAYERPDGGRSFCFTGLDAHSAWSHDGLRQLIVNAILWSARSPVPPNGAPCDIAKLELDAYLTHRGSRTARIASAVSRKLRRLLR